MISAGLKDYAEDSIPVLNDKNELIGVITAQDIVEVVDDELISIKFVVILLPISSSS